MNQCPMTLKAVGGALGTEVFFLCKSTHIVSSEPDYFICVGERAFYFLDENFNRVKGKCNYKHLQRVIVDNNIETILQIHLSEHKDRNMPLKMNLISFDRKNLVFYLNYAWKTDLMYNQLEVRDLPLYRQALKFADKKNKKPVGPPEIMFQLKDQEEKIQINGYVFWFPVKFKNIQTGVYEYKANNSSAEYQLFLQVPNPMPLQVLRKMGINQHLEQYAIKYIEQIVVEYQIKKYYIQYSNAYQRRHNLTEDKSLWKGWEISILTTSTKIRQVSVIILRRMFLPPLFENFNDIILVLFSNNSAVSSQLNKVEARQIADCVYPYNMKLPIYSLIIQEKCNSLFLEDINYEFLLSHDPPLFPKAIQFSFCIVKYFYSKLIGQNNQQKKLKISDAQITNRMERLHIQKWSDELNTVSSFSELILKIQKAINEDFHFDDEIQKNNENNQDQSLINDDKNQMMLQGEEQNLETDLNTANMLSKQMQKFTFKTQNWRKKISRFITFCIDGGLFGDRFTLVDIIEGLQEQRCKKDCENLLEYCLFMYNDDAEITFMGVTKQIEKSIQYLNNFSERVMVQLIKNHFFYIHYIEQDISQSSVYQQLMTYFLMEHNSIEIKKAVCYHLIDRLKKKSDEQALPSQASQILNELVTPLMYQYAKSDDTNLQLYACIALQNILVQVSESKQTMLQNNCIEIIYQKLESPHQKLVNFSLKFIYNLFDGMNSSQIFNLNVLQDKIIAIIKGYQGMKNLKYNIDVTCTALNLVRKILNTNENDFVKFREQMSLFYNILVPPNDMEQDEFYSDQELQEEAIGVISLLANIDKEIKDQIASTRGQYHQVLLYCIELVLNLVNGSLLDRALSLIITLCSDREDLIQYLKMNQLFYSACKFLRFDSKPPAKQNTAQKLEACLWLFNNNPEPEGLDDKSKKKK